MNEIFVTHKLTIFRYLNRYFKKIINTENNLKWHEQNQTLN